MALQPQTRTPAAPQVRRPSRPSTDGGGAPRIPATDGTNANPIRLPWQTLTPAQIAAQSAARAHSDLLSQEQAIPTDSLIRDETTARQSAAQQIADTVAQHLQGIQQYAIGSGAAADAAYASQVRQGSSLAAPAALPGFSSEGGLSALRANTFGGLAAGAELRGLAQQQDLQRQADTRLDENAAKRSNLEAQEAGLAAGYQQTLQKMQQDQLIARQNAGIALLQTTMQMGLKQKQLDAEVARIKATYALGEDQIKATIRGQDTRAGTAADDRAARVAQWNAADRLKARQLSIQWWKAQHGAQATINQHQQDALVEAQKLASDLYTVKGQRSATGLDTVQIAVKDPTTGQVQKQTYDVPATQHIDSQWFRAHSINPASASFVSRQPKTASSVGHTQYPEALRIIEQRLQLRGFAPPVAHGYAVTILNTYWQQGRFGRPVQPAPPDQPPRANPGRQ